MSIGGSDPDVLWRPDMFYAAVGRRLIRNWSTMRLQPLKHTPTRCGRDETNFRGRMNVRP